MNYKLVNKKCPFCRKIIRKEIANYIKQEKFFCQKCPNKFIELDGIFYFIYLGFCIKIDDTTKLVSKENTYIIDKHFDVYNNFNDFVEKTKLFIFE